jgi:C4-dicarboxylate-specific signal transduction histidine kinase
MLTNLIPIFAVFAMLYLIIAIVLQRRRDRLAREREAEREAKRERDRLEERAGRQNKRDLKRSDQLPSSLDVHVDPFAYLRREIPTAQDIVWLNTWLIDEPFDN